MKKNPSTNTQGLIEKGQKNMSTVRVKSNNKSTFKCFINMQEEILVLILSGEGGAVTDDPERAEVTVLFFLLQPSLKRSAGNRWPTTAGTGAEPHMTTLLPGISPRDFMGLWPSWCQGQQSTHSSCPSTAMVHSGSLPKGCWMQRQAGHSRCGTSPFTQNLRWTGFSEKTHMKWQGRKQDGAKHFATISKKK